ncbi:LOW QUALITY PROTEIN: Hypothetical protein PHPALM_37547 [Phytophthora palmivora]|uniref:RxLR effector PexRD54 WY domain-containing protein n=1 Tax=Phytophthora palmivora TaxID=4796 RepID=A0A2P4WX65_9STRA|nr:LOW QUALITY PROTEIN: Hypothetical protein PHPALM_37547 [Phytophthora palmivora]
MDDFNTKYREEPTFMIPTLNKYFSDDVLFKMIETAKNTERTKDIASKVEADWFQAGLRKPKSPNQTLKDLGLGQTINSLLESPLLDMWVKYMDAFNARYPDKKTTMIEAFSHTFGDIDVTTMLHAAKKKDWTRNIATELESAQLKMWLNDKKSTDDVFKLLKLDKEANSFRDKPLFNTWVSYMNFFIAENPDKKARVFSALETRFSDRPLNTILNPASNFPSMESTATKIQTSKIQDYLARETSPEKAFELLALDGVGDGILSTSVFQSWLNYVKDFNKRSPKHQESWFKTLLIRCGWDGVDRMIERALHSQQADTVKIGKMVLQQWLDWVKVPKDTFHFLKLRDADKQALTSPKFNTWAKYLDDFNQRYPNQKTTMIDALRDNFTDRNLLPILSVARKDPATEKLAINLQNALIDEWLAVDMQLKDLELMLRHEVSYENMLERYLTKLAASNKASHPHSLKVP